MASWIKEIIVKIDNDVSDLDKVLKDINSTIKTS